MNSPIDVAAIAANYRQLVLWVFAEILFSFAVPIVPFFGPIVLVTVIGVMFYAYRTAKALGSTAAWLWPIGMLFPLINILGLLELSSRASAIRREHRIEVGLLGPRVK